MEILNIYTVPGDAALILAPLLFLGAVGLVAFICVTIKCFVDGDIGPAFFTLALTMIVAGLLTWGGITAANDPEVTRYEVTFKDDTPLLEITSKYDIVDQEGLIYTLEEKEVD